MLGCKHSPNVMVDDEVTVSGAGGRSEMVDEFSSYEPRIAEELRSTAKAKQHAVKVEDYAEAARCKDRILSLQSVSSRIAEREEQKKTAVSRRDYVEAQRLKLEIESLFRAALEGGRVTEHAAASAKGDTHDAPVISSGDPGTGHQQHPEYEDNDGLEFANDSDSNSKVRLETKFCYDGTGSSCQDDINYSSRYMSGEVETVWFSF